MLSRNEPIEGRRSMGVITASPFSRRDGRSHARDRRQQSPARAPKTNGVPEGFEWHSACPLSLSTCCRFHTVVFLFTACPFAHSMYVMLIFLIIDLRFPLDGSVRLHFSTSPESRLMGVNETHTRFTVESSTGKMRKNSSWLTWPLIIIISSFVFPPFGAVESFYKKKTFCLSLFSVSGDPVVRWDSYDTVTDSTCPDDHHHDVSSSTGSTQSEFVTKLDCKNVVDRERKKRWTGPMALQVRLVDGIGEDTELNFGESLRKETPISFFLAFIIIIYFTSCPPDRTGLVRP